MPQKKMASESHAGASSFFQFSTTIGFDMERWRQKASKTRYECKAFYYVRNLPCGISEPPGAFCIEKTQKL
jgi:hypothetical protein